LIPLPLAIASTAISFMGSMSAARAAKREAALQQRQLEAEKKMNRLRALQEHNIRLANLQTFLNTNQAIAGVSGRDISQDRSLKALQEKAKREMATEVGRARVQELATIGKLSQAQQIAGERGRNRARAFRYQAFGSIISGAMKAAPLMGSAPTASITPRSSLGPTRFSTFNTGIYS
tara:strand:+ start:1799 stop:2329 length:531 start_codon:yes stop_codon:yes gene_type:complete